MRRSVVVLAAVLGVVVVAGGSFYGGMAFQRSRQTNTQQQFFADRGFAPGGFSPLSGTPEGGFAGMGNPSFAGVAGGLARGAGGTVESLEGNTLNLRGDGEEVIVHLTDETVITRMATGERSDLQPGAQVTAIGERDDSGVITAVAIQILSSAP
jgi:hypothetical protein